MNNILFRLFAIFHQVMGGLLLHRHLHVARFARLDELATLASARPRRSGLLLGRTRFRQLLHVTQTKARRELGNLLVVAPTRGGKGLLANSQLLTWKHSVIVNDIKGELFAQTAGYRSTLGKVFVLDPSGVGHRYDPLQGKHSEDALLSVATNLLHRPDEGEGEIFTRRATNMLTQLFLGARLAGHTPLPYVRQLLRTGLPAVAERLHVLDPVLATQFLDVPYEQVNYEDRFLLSAWSTLTARMKPLLTETVVRCFTGTDFSTAQMMTEKAPVTVYLRWPERD